MSKWMWFFKRILLVAGGATAVLVAVAAIEVYTYAQRTETRQADAAIVLGAAVWRDRPSPVFRERINHAIALYQDGYVDTLIFTGGQGDAGEQTEAEVARQYALARGIPEADTLLETTSTNTWENLTNAQQVAVTRELQTFLIVSTPFHMRRAMAIANDLGLEAYTSPTRSTRWISPYTKSRAYLREVVVYMIYIVDRTGIPVVSLLTDR